ncbi:YqaJ viral recombinase family protein, partial [Borreliella valaisiana]|uniref:YqaJ viral recombinase family protein n=1 Tax=Borreliella valaisiana TaxID=62088 RepID=UPI001AEFF1CF
MTNIEKNQENIKNGMSNMIHIKQQSFTGCEVFEEKTLPIKEKSKLSKIGKKLPGISSQECFRFNRNIDFSLQRSKLDKYGASEVGTVVIGVTGLKDVMINSVLKYFGMSLPFEENLYMLKGKELENLGFREFVKAHGDNIAVLYKNKYANGVDKYNYFKKIDNFEPLVGSTIDGWFMNIYGDIELLEIKSSDSHYMSSAIEEYNKNGNFLSSKYFFKYYVQAQMQLACTGLEYCNLFFLIDVAPVNCKIKRNDSLISKVLNFVLKCEREVFNIRTEIVKNNQAKLLISNNIDNDTFNKLVEEIEEL